MIARFSDDASCLLPRVVENGGGSATSVVFRDRERRLVGRGS